MQTARKVVAVKSTNTHAALNSLLKNAVEGKDLLKLRTGTELFSQGEEGDAIYFIQTGQVLRTVVSAQGKKALLTKLGPRDFLGEECLARNSRRTSTATSLEPSTVFRIEKRAMLQALHLHPKFSDGFVASLLARNVNLEEDLRDQLLDQGERRLAGALLKFSRYGKHDKQPDAKLLKVTQKVLAEIGGTTRSKVYFFMNRFRALGLIDSHMIDRAATIRRFW